MRSKKDYHPRTYLPNGVVIIHPLPNPPEEPNVDPDELRRGVEYLEAIAVHGFLYKGGLSEEPLDQHYDYIKAHLKTVGDRQRGD